VRTQTRGSIAALALVVAACAPGREPDEVGPYLQQLQAWAPQEAEAARAVTRILRTQFVDEAEVRRQIDESLPRVSAQVAALTAYRPRGAAIGTIHTRYLEGWRHLQRGYEDILRGLDTGDQAALGRGRAELLAWRETLRETADRLQEAGAAPASEMERGPPT
jgi:hypothetical protein